MRAVPPARSMGSMFVHPDLLQEVMRQRHQDLLEEAERRRLARRNGSANARRFDVRTRLRGGGLKPPKLEPRKS